MKLQKIVAKNRHGVISRHSPPHVSLTRPAAPGRHPLGMAEVLPENIWSGSTTETALDRVGQGVPPGTRLALLALVGGGYG